MILSEVSVGLDTLAGGSVVGMLVAVMTAFMRRTKDVDERRDEATRMVMDVALEREARAGAERDAAKNEAERYRAERNAARDEADRYRNLLEKERGRQSRRAAADSYDGRWQEDT